MSNLISILNELQDVKVISKELNKADFVPLDLSKNNFDLQQFDCDNAVEFESYIDSYLIKNKAKVAYGGYNEIRSLYKRSSIFNSENKAERNIHIGLDLWINAETPVLAALDGKVHSFNTNLGLGNYGPTIILEHSIDTIVFYTLYGHLSKNSLSNLKVGQEIIKGEQIATLGDYRVNGNYAPHLHFQIIDDIKQNFGDFPGVCSADELAYYLNNCPDPNLLLKL